MFINFFDCCCQIYVEVRVPTESFLDQAIHPNLYCGALYWTKSEDLVQACRKGKISRNLYVLFIYFIFIVKYVRQADDPRNGER